MLKSKRIFGLIILGLFLVQLFFMTSIFGLQDDSHLEVTLHAKLNSNSNEIKSELMNLGSYTFFETPQLDTGTFEHDLTTIDIVDLQKPSYNKTDDQTNSLVIGVNATLNGNSTIYLNKTDGFLSQYECGSNFNTRININLNYSSNDNREIEIFHEDFKGAYWQFDGATNKYLLVGYECTEDSWVNMLSMDSNYGTDTALHLERTLSGVYRKFVYLQFDYSSVYSPFSSYFRDNKTGSPNDVLVIYAKGMWGGALKNRLYSVDSYFDEDTITYNNKPDADVHLDDLICDDYAWAEFNIGSKESNYKSFQIRTLDYNNDYGWFASKETSNKPYYGIYYAKNYQDTTNGYIYMQTDQTETLSLKSPIYDEKYLQKGDKIVIQCKTTNTKQIQLNLLNDNNVLKQLVVIPEGNSNFGLQTIELTLDENIVIDQMIFTGELDDTYFRCNDIKINQYSGQFFLSKGYIKDFNYTVLNQAYTENFELVLDDANDYEKVGNYTFYFDSTQFNYRSSNQDVIIPTQNITLILSLSHNRDVNFTAYLEYSTNTWMIPTEANLKINGGDVIDETFNSGFISLVEYPNTLEITADFDVLFKLNITTYFVFKIDLSVISKTYLKKNFKLLSDHHIYIERLDLPNDLEIKKIYLNNYDLGATNPNILDPPKSMDTSNIYSLEVILSDSLYLQLNRIYNTLGYGTSTLFFKGTTNSLSFNNIDQFTELELVIPNGHDPYSANLDFSNIRYTPAYESNNSHNIYGNYEETQSFQDPAITYNNSAYTHGEWDIYGEETTPTNFSMNEGYLTQNGSLYNIDSDTTNFTTEHLGYYNASYSFTDDLVGSVPLGWIDASESGCSSGVIYNVDGHRKVLELEDESATYSAKTYNYFSETSSGNIEFWISSSSNSADAYVLVYDGVSSDSIYFRLSDDGYIRYYDGSYHVVRSYSANTWYHIRFEWNCSSGWYLYIDGISYGMYSFYGTPISMDTFYSLTGGTDTSFSCYLDAVGYSWLSNYTIGDNNHSQYSIEDYPATYSFTNDSLGSVPNGWINASESGCSSAVIDYLDGHKKVLELNDEVSGNLAGIKDIFSSEKATGTAEFWLRTTILTKYSYFTFRNSTDGVAFYIMICGGGVRFYYDGGSYTETSINVNQWYHVRLDFDCTTETVSFYLDGVSILLYGSFYDEGVGNLNYFLTYTNPTHEDYSVYIDAVGYSWTTNNYILGDNWHYNYHLGNQTFENYNTSSYGDYYGSYSFNEDSIGSFPIGWNDNSGSGCTCSIISSLSDFDGHKNVLNLDDTTSSYSCDMNHVFETSQTSGTVEFWWRVSSTTERTYAILYEGGYGVINFVIDTGDFKYHDGSTYQTITSASANHWYHIRFDFECGDGGYEGLSHDTFYVYIDGTKYGAYSFQLADTTNVESMRLLTRDTFVGNSYFDAIGISWYSNYTIGDNENPYGKIQELRDEGWSFDVGSYNQIRISGEDNSHRKIIEIIDGTSSETARSYYNFSYQSYGSIEYWLKTTEAGETNTMRLFKNDDSILRFRIDSDKFQYYDGSWHDTGLGALDDTWYHIRIDFECTTGGYQGLAQYDWHVFIDGIQYGDYDFETNLAEINQYYVGTGTSATGYTYYIDSLSFSWDENYSIGDNLKTNNPIEIDFTTYIDFNYTKFHNDTEATLKSISLYYSYKTDISTNIKFYIWNYELLDWFSINSSVNNNNFYDLYYELNSSFYDTNYQISLKFYGYNNTDEFDLFLDKLLLELNYTILFISPPLLNVGYKNPVLVNEIFNISINVQISYYNISEVRFYDSFTGVNKLIGNNEGNYNVSLSITSSQYYDIWVFVNDTEGAWKTIEISNLFVCKIATYIDILNLKNVYYQNNTLSIDIKLRDYLSLEIPNQTINLILTNQTNDLLNNTDFITDIIGTFQFNIYLNYSYLGFYHLNFTLESEIYLNYSKLISFEILPIERLVNTQQIDLKVNGFNIIDNSIIINETKTFDITCLNHTIFDLDIYFKLVYNEIFSYNSHFDYKYTLEATNDILYFTINDAKIMDYPTDFDVYMFNSMVSENYEISGENFVINDLLGDTLYDDNTVELGFSRYENSYIKNQLTENPRTDINEVIFEEWYLANRTYTYWYFTNELEKNEFTLTHARTNNLLTSFEIENNKYYFEESSLQNDIYILTANYNPNWYITYEILENNGTYSKIKINYKADLNIENVSLILNLKNESCYNEDWTYSAHQNSANLKLEIPGINFTTGLQTIVIEGYSSIPHANITYYESDQNYNRITENTEIDFAGFIKYSKYTKLFTLTKSESWTAYNVYYGNETYSVETISNTLIQVQGDGFDPKITDSYLHFTTKPFFKVDWQYENKIITIMINSTMDVDNAYFLYQFDPSGVHTLNILESNITINELSDSGDSEGYLSFTTPRVNQGITIIKIKVNFATPLEMLVQSIIIFSVCGAFIGIYYYLKTNEEALKKVKGFVDKKVLSKLKRSKEEKGLNEVVLEIKNNKIYFKKK